MHTPENPLYLRGKCDTKDKVFCLSRDEVIAYFAVYDTQPAEFVRILDPAAIAEATTVTVKTAVKKGGHTATEKYFDWMLRDSADYYNFMQVYVSELINLDANLSVYGGGWTGVRPAMWVDIGTLEKLMQ